MRFNPNAAALGSNWLSTSCAWIMAADADLAADLAQALLVALRVRLALQARREELELQASLVLRVQALPVVVVAVGSTVPLRVP
jgi:hypothetical protein